MAVMTRAAAFSATTSADGQVSGKRAELQDIGHVVGEALPKLEAG